ncbi:hypothetical protein JTE90_020951 [Oedothorax gibbosus]|uniref:Uncharacterized protein n=1 Tax=Oedothorax gibbosus TaxID=931172 RepID=A0AAV6THB4_9ARAC|nr:hypothetical protein JTE90_020951 [Oedothorax gibbosus]
MWITKNRCTEAVLTLHAPVYVFYSCWKRQEKVSSHDFAGTEPATLYQTPSPQNPPPPDEPAARTGFGEGPTFLEKKSGNMRLPSHVQQISAISSNNQDKLAEMADGIMSAAFGAAAAVRYVHKQLMLQWNVGQRGDISAPDAAGDFVQAESVGSTPPLHVKRTRKAERSPAICKPPRPNSQYVGTTEFSEKKASNADNFVSGCRKTEGAVTQSRG